MAIRRAACGHSPEPVSPLWRLPDQFASTPACKAVKAKSSILRNVTLNCIILPRNASRKTKTSSPAQQNKGE